MTTKDEALKLALEALRLYQRTLATADTQCKGVAAVAAIEQALAAQPAPVHALRSVIANDVWAISFQSLGQYRSALLKLIDTEQASQEKG